MAARRSYSYNDNVLLRLLYIIEKSLSQSVVRLSSAVSNCLTVAKSLLSYNYILLIP